jgi:hypothetical protein
MVQVWLTVEEGAARQGREQGLPACARQAHCGSGVKLASGPRAAAAFGKEQRKNFAENSERNHGVRKRICQRMSTEAWTMAEAKMEPVLRQVQP